MLFGICPCTSRTAKFWHTYVITYDDFMVIIKPCQFPLTFHHIHSGMSRFIALLMTILVLIGTVFMII